MKRLLVVVVCLFVQQQLQRCTADCDLALHIDPGRSHFNVTGVANSDLLQNIELEPAYATQRVGFRGSLRFVAPGGCPANQRQLERVLTAGNFTLDARDTLELYPSNATLLATVLARLDFLDLRFSYRWRDVEATGRRNDRVRGRTTLEVLEGAVHYTVNETLGLDVEPGEASLVDLKSRQSQEGRFAINGTKLEFEIRQAMFSFVTEVETGIDLLPVINATLNLTGDIVAEAFIECSDIDCGQNGRCVALESGESVCECACGWTGGTCEIPSGFCDVFGDAEPSVQLNVASQGLEMETVRSNEEREANLLQQCEELFTAQQCPDERSTYSLEQNGCACVEGWRGTACDICEAGGACPAFFEEGAACLVDGAYDARSGEKIYECDLRTTGLDVFIGNAIKFVCNTTGPRFYDAEFQTLIQNDPSAIDPVDNTPFCRVDFTFQDVTPVNCTAWGCTYRPGSMKVECSTMQCDCEDCSTIEGLVNGITSVQLDCNEQNNCIVEFGGLSVAVEAPCQIGECLLPSNPDFRAFGGSDDGFEMNWDIFIISMPLVFLGLLLSIFLIPTAALAVEMARLDDDYGKVASKAESRHEGADICFRNVRCMVPMRSSARASNRWLRWFRGRSDTDSDNTYATMHPVRQLRGLDQSLQIRAEAPTGYRSVLHGVSGTVQKGKLMAVMGPSGGGKTTFLSIVCSVSAENGSRRIVNGEILVNGRRTGRWTKRHVAFVPQDDNLISTLTVQESLMYSAILRKPGCAMAELEQKVNETLNELSLMNVRHSQVGGVRKRRGVSGGERRRVTIGMELVINPDLIILDEPTSGLDSFTALNLMHTLKSVCSGGRTVILSVHQPTPAMLDMLDQVLLLAKGYQVYLGPPSQAASFFAKHGFERKDEQVHVAEYMLQVVSGPETLTALLNSVYSGSGAELPGQTDSGNGSRSDSPDTDAAPPVKQKLSTIMQVLLWRGFTDIIRNPALLLAHVVVAVAIGAFCGVIFFDAPLTVEGAQNRLGAAFFVLAFLGFWSLTTVDLLQAERSIVARETSSGYYNAYVYLISKIVLDAVLLRILPAALMTVPLYLMMHLQRTVEKFVIFLLTVSTFNCTVGLLSMAVTLLSPSAGTASLLINTVLLVGLLFTGHLVNVPSIPRSVRWIHYLSPFHYGFQALAVNEMVGLRLNFNIPGYADVDGIGGDVFLRTVGIEDQNITQDLTAFLVFYAVAFCLTYVAMWLSRHSDQIYNAIFSIFKKEK